MDTSTTVTGLSRSSRPVALRGLIVAGVAAACTLGLSPAPTDAATTQRVDVYDARFAGEMWANATAKQGRLTREKRLRLAFASEATGLTFRGGQAQGGVPVSSRTLFQPRYTDVFTDPDWIDGSCTPERWGMPTGGRLVVSDLVGENGGMVARFGPADHYDGGRRCTGRALGWSGPTTDNGLAFDARFEIPRSEVGGRVIQVPVEGKAGGCPATPYDTWCDSRFDGEVTLTLRHQHVEETPDGRPAPGPVPAAPAPRPTGGAPAKAPTQAPAKPTGDAKGEKKAKRLVTKLRGAAGRKHGTVTATCRLACTGTVSAYAVAVAKQGRGTPKPKLVGRGRLTRLRGGAAPRAAGGRVRIGRRVRFRAGSRAVVRSRGRIEYRVSVRPAAGGPTQRATVLARVRR